MEAERITSVEDLKSAASENGGADCFILLNYGLRSSKHISYAEDEKIFYVLNLIDGSEQQLTADQLVDKSYTNIGYAMKNGAFFKEG